MSWRIAESLKKLREQINARWANRDKSSDGGIGDAAHASRSSDHNPWVKDSKGQGVVTAIDIDEDLAGDINSIQFLVDAIIASRDPRVKYIIYEGRMCSSYPAGGVGAWKWRSYSGKNPHKQHAHISVNPSPYHYDSRAEWAISAPMLAAIQEDADNPDESGRVPSEPVAELILEMPAKKEVSSQQSAVGREEIATHDAAAKPADTDQPPAIVESERVGEGASASGETEYLKKERPSIFTKAIAGVTAVTTFISGLGIGLDSVFNRIAAEITLKQVVVMALCFGLGAIALWFYDRSANRANRLNAQKIDHAANNSVSTVELT